MRREIEVTKEDREFLRKLFGVSEPTVYTALKLDKPETDVRKRIRKAAMERGGEVMVTLREMETIHDANNMMVQVFPNGARLEINKLNGSTKVLYKGEEMATCVIEGISLLNDIQIMASMLGGKAKERS